MIKISNGNITLTKGDTLLVQIELGEGSYIPTDGDRIRFALKENYDDTVPLILQPISTDSLLLRVEGEKTKILSTEKTYVYDIEITTVDGIIDTFLSGRLKVTNEVH